MTKQGIIDLKKTAILKANEERAWYLSNSRKKRNASKTLRVLTIVIIGIGTLCPLLDSTGVFGEVGLSKWGYIAFAIAGIFIGFDRFFGISSGWIRYTLAIIEINKLEADFEYTWNQKELDAKGDSLSNEQTNDLLAFIKKFSDNISGVVQQETQLWANEFESSLLELRKSTKGS